MEQQGHRLQQHGGTTGHRPEQTAGMAEKVQDAASAVAEKAGDVWESTKQTACAVGSTAGDAWTEVSDFVRRHPIACLAAGSGLGFLLMQAMAGPQRGRGTWSSSKYDYRPWQGEDRPFSHGGLGHGQESSGSGSHGVAERAQELASTVAEKAGEAWHGTQRMASTVASGTGDAWTGATAYGRDYPLVTLAVGAGLGFALAHLLGGKILPGFGGRGERSQSERGGLGRSGGGI